MTWLNTFVAFVAGFMTCGALVFIGFLMSAAEVERHDRAMTDYRDRGKGVREEC